MALIDSPIRKLLGSAVTYTPGGGAPQQVRGVFESAYARADAGNPGISTAVPAFFARVSELASNPMVDLEALVTVDGTVYRIREVQPDGLGGVVLLLHLV